MIDLYRVFHDDEAKKKKEKKQRECTFKFVQDEHQYSMSGGHPHEVQQYNNY